MFYDCLWNFVGSVYPCVRRTYLLHVLPGKFTRRGSTDTAADADSLSAKHSHSHHSLLRDMPDHSNSHSDNTVKEGKEVAQSMSAESNVRPRKKKKGNLMLE